jgi:hypothetical protein
VEKYLCCCSLNHFFQTVELKAEEIKIKPSFGIFSNIDILIFH